MSWSKKRVSVINEHTAAYTLIDRILPLLKTRFAKAIPINYWATREGSPLSQYMMEDCSLLVLAMFPRRPKFSLNTPEEIVVKINESVVEDADFLKQNGIAVIAGAPIIQSLAELDGTAPCVWYPLDQVTSEHYHVHRYPFDFNAVKGTLNEHKMSEYIQRNALPMTLIIRQMRSKHSSRFPYFGGANRYKPIYFLLFE